VDQLKEGFGVPFKMDFEPNTEIIGSTDQGEIPPSLPDFS
jgi:hypothetical protein